MLKIKTNKQKLKEQLVINEIMKNRFKRVLNYIERQQEFYGNEIPKEVEEHLNNIYLILRD